MGNNCNLLGEGGVDTSLLFFLPALSDHLLQLLQLDTTCMNRRRLSRMGGRRFFRQEGVQGGDFHAGMP